MELKQRTYVSESREAEPRLLITGGVHGDEFAPMAAVRRLIRQFDEAPSTLLRGTLQLVPVVNESAFGRGGRCGDDDLDLARVCPGSETGSITERTAYALSRLIADADYYIDLHTGGSAFSVLPLAGYSLHKNPQVLERQREIARIFNLPTIWGTSGELDGRSLSVARDHNVPAIYTEYFGSGGYHHQAVRDYTDGCLNVMGMLRMLYRVQPTPRIERVVEDPRPASGHMQVCNPSPASGFFEPAVQLGDEVRCGDTLGTVSDPLGETTTAVISQQEGTVLVLRMFSLVRQGESVGVIMEAVGG